MPNIPSVDYGDNTRTPVLSGIALAVLSLLLGLFALSPRTRRRYRRAGESGEIIIPLVHGSHIGFNKTSLLSVMGLAVLSLLLGLVPVDLSSSPRHHNDESDIQGGSGMELFTDIDIDHSPRVGYFKIAGPGRAGLSVLSLLLSLAVLCLSIRYCAYKTNMSSEIIPVAYRLGTNYGNSNPDRNTSVTETSPDFIGGAGGFEVPCARASCDTGLPAPGTTSMLDERRQVLGLPPFPPPERHQAIRDARVVGVGDWLLRNQSFSTWRTSEGRTEKPVLFCYGHPGAGKTYIRCEPPPPPNTLPF